MNKILLFLLICFISFLSCRQSDIEKQMTRNHAVWYIFDYDSISNNFMNSNYGYIFKTNGTCDYIHYDFSRNKVAVYKNIMNDVKEFNNWKYSDQQFLTIRGDLWEIVNFRKDTICLKSNYGHYNLLVNLRDINPETLPFLENTFLLCNTKN